MASEITNPATTSSHPTQPGQVSEDATEAISVIRPEETLAALRSLWSAHGDSAKFFEILAEYGRGLIGAVSVSIFEQKGDSAPALLGFSSASGKKRSRGAHLPDTSLIADVLGALSSRRYRVMLENREHLVLLTPLALREGGKVCFAAILPPERASFSDPCFVILHLLTQFLIQRDLLSEAGENSSAFVQATLLVEMFTRTGEASNFPRALFTLANELEKFFGCRRVALGTGNNRKCRVHAVSGKSSEDRKGIGISQLAEAMKEAISLQKIMAWPAPKSLPDEVVVSANHDDLLHSYRSGSLLIAPLIDHRGRSQGAVALLWPMNAEPGRREYRLLEACQPISPP